MCALLTFFCNAQGGDRKGEKNAKVVGILGIPARLGNLASCQLATTWHCHCRPPFFLLAMPTAKRGLGSSWQCQLPVGTWQKVGISHQPGMVGKRLALARHATWQRKSCDAKFQFEFSERQNRPWTGTSWRHCGGNCKTPHSPWTCKPAWRRKRTTKTVGVVTRLKAAAAAAAVAARAAKGSVSCPSIRRSRSTAILTVPVPTGNGNAIGIAIASWQGERCQPG